MSTSNTVHYSDAHDISALLNQYIAEATEGEDSTPDADFDFVDLDQLVKTAYEASECNDEASLISLESTDVSNDFNCHDPDVIDPLRLENENIAPTYQQLLNIENHTHISSFVEKNYPNKVVQQDPILRENFKTVKEIKKRSKYEPYLSSVSKPKRVRPSRARLFRADEVCCFHCKTAFKRPQSLKAHLMHRHRMQLEFKITLRI